MESKIQKQEQQMLMYWEQSASGLQEEDSNTEVEDEDNVSQKPHMRAMKKKNGWKILR